MDDSTITKAVPAAVAGPLRKLAAYLRQNPVSAAIFVIGVLYSTIFIEYVADERYFDFFQSQGVRAACVVAVAGAAYVDPRNSVVYLVVLLRTFRYVRKENFGVEDIKALAKPEWMKRAEARAAGAAGAGGDAGSDSSTDEVIALDDEFIDD